MVHATHIRNRRVVITGATDGIGRIAAEHFAALGAHLVLHGRNDVRLRSAAARMPNPVSTVRADLAALAQVRDLVDDLAAYEPIDVLVLNAGIGPAPDLERRVLSADGFELRWAVNFLAPFAIAEWLMALGKAPYLVVNVASIGQAAIDFDDLRMDKKYDGWLAYQRSKLALVMWTRDLTNRHSVHAVALHPGTFLATKMVSEADVAPQGTVVSGAQAIVDVTLKALDGEHDGTFFDVRQPVRANRQAYDEKAQARLRAAAVKSIQPFGRGLVVPL